MNNVEATVFAYLTVAMTFTSFIYARFIVREIRATTREYRTRALTGRKYTP